MGENNLSLNEKYSTLSIVRYLEGHTNINGFINNIYKSSFMPILIWKKSGEIIEYNDEFGKLTGFSKANIGGNIDSYISLSSKDKLEFNNKIENGNQESIEVEELTFNTKLGQLPLRFTCFFLYDKRYNDYKVVSFIENISEHKNKNQLIKKLLTKDELTELDNRFVFENDVIKYINENKAFTAFLIDLDNFAAVNDIYGHRVGDKYIKRIAKDLLDIKNAKAYRWTGDEILVLISSDSISIKATIDDIQSIVSEKRIIDNKIISVSCCLGVISYPEHGKRVEQLHQHLDIALNEAKRLGPNQYCVYNTIYKNKILNNNKLIEGIDDALLNDDFELYFQPVFSIGSRKIKKVEVLLRWFNNPLSNSNIGEVIQFAEGSGQIDHIDRWVIKNTLKFIRDCRCAHEKFIFSINVSAKAFHSNGFVVSLLEALKKYHVLASCIEIEITEYSLLKDIEISKKVIEQLKANGIRIAMDDFGTKYSSLNYLSAIPFDTLKIDKSYIDRILTNERDKVIVKNIIHLSKELLIDVVAEGIETIEQEMLLEEMGCEYGQGYLVSKPLEGKKLKTLVCTMG